MTADRAVATLAALFAAAAAAGSLALPATAQAQFQLDTTRPAFGLPLGGPFDGDLAMADVDGDGDLDLIASGYSVNLHRRQPDGSFTYSQITVGTGLGARRIQLADVDGDGDLDLLLSPRDGSHSNLVSLLLNGGLGTFSPATLPAPLAGAVVRGAVLGDVDGDGDQDLVVTAGATVVPVQNVQLFRNNGATTFAYDAAAMPATLPGNSWPALGDVDGDGDLDVACSSVSGASTLLDNDGTGAFTDISGQLPTTRLGYVWTGSRDLDGDGFDDVVQLWWNGDLDVTWGAAGPLALAGVAAGGTTQALFADLDGDADLDVVLPTGTGFRTVRNDGARQLSAAAGVEGIDEVRGIGAGPVNADAAADVLLAFAAHSTLSVVFGGPALVHDPVLERGFGAPRVSRHAPPVVGDIDGDGHTDVVYVSTASSEVLYGRGAGRYRKVVQLQPAAGGGVLHNHMHDLDGDGDLDILVAAHQNLRTWHNDGTGAFTPAFSYVDASPFESDVVVEDLDRDGDLDVVRVCRDSFRLFRNHGDGTFAAPTALATGPFSAEPVLAVMDADNDGDRDLVTNLPGVGQVHAIFANDGAGHFTVATTPAIPWFLGIVTQAAADYDGDGDADLVVAYTGTPQARLLRNDGAAGFAVQAMPTLANSTDLQLYAADLDDDGDVDLLRPVDFPNNAPQVLLNDGSGAFVNATSSRWSPVTGSNPPDYALLDFDEDGDLDVFAGAPASFHLVVVNHARQLASATVPRSGGTLALDMFSGPGYGTPGLSMLLAAFDQRQGGGIEVPGFRGRFGLDIASTVVVAVSVNSTVGRSRVIVAVPPDPAFAGLGLYWQQLLLPGPGRDPGFSNVVVERILP